MKTSDKLRTYDTLGQASKLLKLPIEVLKWAKREGCPYFPGSRVTGDVIDWLKDNPYPTSTAELPAKELLERKRIQKQNRDLDTKHDIKMGKYVLRDEAKSSWSKAMDGVQKVMLTFIDKSVYNKAVRELKRELEALDL